MVSHSCFTAYSENFCSDSIRHIPTPVIWCIFEALVSVACLMRDGHIPTDMPPNGWAGSMLHRDIKPKNGRYHLL